MHYFKHSRDELLQDFYLVGDNFICHPVSPQAECAAPGRKGLRASGRTCFVPSTAKPSSVTSPLISRWRAQTSNVTFVTPDLGCRRNVSIHVHPPMSVRIGEIRDIRALCWCPCVIVSHLNFSLHIFYKQSQRIRPIRDVLQCNFCMLAKISGMDVNLR